MRGTLATQRTAKEAAEERVRELRARLEEFEAECAVQTTQITDTERQVSGLFERTADLKAEKIQAEARTKEMEDRMSQLSGVHNQQTSRLREVNALLGKMRGALGEIGGISGKYAMPVGA